MSATVGSEGAARVITARVTTARVIAIAAVLAAGGFLLSGKGLAASLETSGSPSAPSAPAAPAAPATVGPASGRPMLFQRIGARVVRVIAVEEGGRTGFGSGVPIGRDLVVTNCHVTRHANAIRVIARGDEGGVALDVEAQAIDVEHDLCLLRTVGSLPFKPFSTGAPPGLGEWVVGIGFTGGVRLGIQPGTVTALYPWDGASVVRSSTAFNSGASGGGLFNRSDELVGILTFRGRAGTAPFFSLPVAWIRDLLGRSTFVAVAPQGAAPSFWEKGGGDQPAFLREFEEGLTGSPPTVPSR